MDLFLSRSITETASFTFQDTIDPGKVENVQVTCTDLIITVGFTTTGDDGSSTGGG